MRTQKRFQKATIVLGFICIASALLLVYSKHLNRQYFAALQAENKVEERLQEEWGQLLLERSTLTAQTRVERLAREKLGMGFPDKQKIIEVPE
ncbi:MAG: cell division protein FtsL [Gammaproteobacteria bacterium]|nr:cell division protein FtsL [Gammaproteobacteria bacterium]